MGVRKGYELLMAPDNELPTYPHLPATYMPPPPYLQVVPDDGEQRCHPPGRVGERVQHDGDDHVRQHGVVAGLGGGRRTAAAAQREGGERAESS